MTSRASSGPGLTLTKKTAQAVCALFAVNLVRSLTPRLDLSLNAQYLRSDSNDRLRDLSKRQVELSVRYRL